MKTRVLLIVLLLTATLAGCQVAPLPTAIPATEPPPTATESPTAVPTAEPKPTAAPTAQPITLTRTENEAMGISVLVPEGWSEVAPGAYGRAQSPTDITRLIQQAAPGATAEDIAGSLLPQLGIAALPEPTGTLETEALAWTLYEIEVEVPSLGKIAVDLALAETEAAAYVVLLQTMPDDYAALHEAAFLPAVEGLRLPAAVEDEAVYADPTGLFTVPLPTNWTVREAEDYVTLLSPEEKLVVHIVPLDVDDTKAAVDEAWQIAAPEFEKEETETVDIPPSAAKGVDEFILVNYKYDEGQPIVQVEGRRHGDKVFVLIFILDLEAFQQRAAQVQLIDTGFDILALEKVDLSGVAPLPLSDELIAELEAFIEAQMAALEVPGAAIAIVRDGQVVYAQGYGLRDLDTGEPVTPETLMMVGSTTKPMTTMLMGYLVDQGVFDWDTRVVEILPSFRVKDPEITERLTMRNLVCACTGVPRRDLEWLFNADELEAEDIITSLADFEFFTDFGEAFQYSNQMVAAGGYIATLAAGGEMDTLLNDYVALFQERVLDPLGMVDTTFSFEAVAADDDYATPYGLDVLGDLVPLPLSMEATLLPVAPAGALWSNVLDMAQFVITNLNEGVAPDGVRVVSAENLAVTWEPQVDISADASYGLGWIVEEYKGLQVLSHAGNTFGFTSELAFVPEANLGVTILTNQRASGLNAVVRVRLMELLYDQPSEVEELLQFALERGVKALEKLAESLVEIDGDAVAPYLGDYTHDALGPMALAWEEGRLMADVGEFQFEIRAAEDEGEVEYFTFTPPVAGLPVEFAEDDDGNPTVVLGVGLVEYTFEKAE